MNARPTVAPSSPDTTKDCVVNAQPDSVGCPSARFSRIDNAALPGNPRCGIRLPFLSTLQFVTFIKLQYAILANERMAATAANRPRVGELAMQHFRFCAPASALILALAPGLPAHAAPPVTQSADAYENAIHNASTSPSYVLVAIGDGDGDTAETKPVCTTANFLLGAIRIEYRLGTGAANFSRAAEIAIEHRDHVFRFWQPAALDNIPVRYSASDLSAARALLAPLSTPDLKAGFSSLHSNARIATDGYARDAIACALIERGLAPRQADITGQVFIKP